jgi:hypothetical protein
MRRSIEEFIHILLQLIQRRLIDIDQVPRVEVIVRHILVGFGCQTHAAKQPCRTYSGI